MKLLTKISAGAALALAVVQSGWAVEAGAAAPDCSLTPMAGGASYGLKQFQGKVVYVDFWASWCAPCAQSFPFLNKLQQELKDQGLQVIGVNLDEAPEDAQTFLAKFPAEFTVASDANQQCAKDFDVKAMPSSYLIDRKGVIRHVHYGFKPEEAKEFRRLAEQMLADSPAK
jgi:peroxiredoxin